MRALVCLDAAVRQQVPVEGVVPVRARYESSSLTGRGVVMAVVERPQTSRSLACACFAALLRSRAENTSGGSLFPDCPNEGPFALGPAGPGG